MNTFPFIHLNFFHAVVNILALVPLLERFEAEHGTLTSLALFFGRGFTLLRLRLSKVLTQVASFCDITNNYLPPYRKGHITGEYGGYGC